MFLSFCTCWCASCFIINQICLCLFSLRQSYRINNSEALSSTVQPKCAHRNVTQFLPRDAMLARYLLSSCVSLSVRPSVRPSQAGIASKRLHKSSWYSARRLPSTYPTLCYKEIWASPKRVLPSETLDLENCAAASRSRCQRIVVVVDGRACWRHLYDNRRVVAVYYKSIIFNPLTPFDLLWICRTTCFYSWQDLDWHSASRGPSAVAELLVETPVELRVHAVAWSGIGSRLYLRLLIMSLNNANHCQYVNLIGVSALGQYGRFVRWPQAGFARRNSQVAVCCVSIVRWSETATCDVMTAIIRLTESLLIERGSADNAWRTLPPGSAVR